MSIWGIFEFIASLNEKPTKPILLKLGDIPGVNQLIASYLTIDDLFCLKPITLLGYNESFFMELYLVLPRLYKKITIRDNEYLINNYKMDPYDIKFMDRKYKYDKPIFD
jgi:hypothetical protein